MITSSAARHVFLIARSGPENNFRYFPLRLETTGPASRQRKFKDQDSGYKVEFMVCLMDVLMGNTLFIHSSLPTRHSWQMMATLFNPIYILRGFFSSLPLWPAAVRAV